ncbi:hypothetical protein [Vibrio phage vB_VpaP_G1]|uniref:Uncharacterized protein n=1 Tax=Vibrio phage vB_VpaP_G1 TaxID=2862773 RepID=A0AAE7WU16_9CAUD|nr:hypothetical protein PP280_gp11 [Vibrio phage vB_VpaP_G1]QYW05811.1 hypothetical protein [Vibrio phage vB_VpaP_G1]
MTKQRLNKLLAKYREGQYTCPTPDVCTYHWSALAWVAWINKKGTWL